MSEEIKSEVKETPWISNRIETGPVNFSDDWCGCFIRGDNALFYAYQLKNYLAGNIDEFTTMYLNELAQLLGSCDQRLSSEELGRHGYEVQKLKNFKECKLEL